MLFPLSPNTPECAVFRVLNNELLHFLNASITAVDFGEALFSVYQHEGQQKRSVCYENESTREKFRALWQVLPHEQQDRENLFELVNDGQEIAAYFNDSSLVLPELDNENLFEAFKALTSHLFTRTKDLNGAKHQSHDTIEQHFQSFKQANNESQLCYLCGTAHLSQDRPGLEPDDQWRADYDHVLCKDKYPIYSVHPGNFIPTCHTCNSKAKGARNLLLCDGGRRTAFYPLPPSNESCHQWAIIETKFRDINDLLHGEWQDPLSSVGVSFDTAPPGISLKISVWDEVYQVPARVEQYIRAHFFERISSDLRPSDLADLRAQLVRHTNGLPQDYKKTEWRFWLFKTYEFLVKQNDEFLSDIWSLLEWKESLSSQEDMQETFGL